MGNSNCIEQNNLEELEISQLSHQKEHVPDQEVQFEWKTQEVNEAPNEEVLLEERVDCEYHEPTETLSSNGFCEYIHNESQTEPQSQICTERQTEPQDIQSMEGKLLRVKNLTKNLLVERYCVLEKQKFYYFKSEFSYLCRNKPIGFLDTKLVAAVRRSSKGPNYFLELLYKSEPDTENTSMNIPSKQSSNSPFKVEKGHLMSRPRFLDPHPKRFTKSATTKKLTPTKKEKFRESNYKVRESKVSLTKQENELYLYENKLLFATPNKQEWLEWQRAFSIILGINIIKA
mmetsp:Transcript_15754/g.22828  ORF Transcript_15754/g.22828 Transcript_15754/m.22828 type:complete len:288 (+) Transcript_15754:2197-3060(+)